MILSLLLILLNFCIYKNTNKIANFINVYDKPDKVLKKHKVSTPLLGGLILILNLILIIIFNFLFNYDLFKGNFSLRAICSIVFFVTSFFFLGLIDDKYGLMPEKKIILSILFSIIILTLNDDLILSDIRISFYKNPIFLNNFSYFFTIFCIIILINSINFYDGINGQSIIFFTICFSYLAYRSQINIFYILVILILLILLILNLRGKIFMGDNGIYLLGSILITSLIYEYNYFESIIFVDEIFFLLIIPGFDLVRLTVTRVYNGKNAFYGDRNHIHHLLIKKYSLLRTNLILLLLTLLPIFSYSLIRINFFVVLILITIIYVSLIFKLKYNDKKYYIRKKK